MILRFEEEIPKEALDLATEKSIAKVLMFFL